MMYGTLTVSKGAQMNEVSEGHNKQPSVHSKPNMAGAFMADKVSFQHLHKYVTPQLLDCGGLIKPKVHLEK